MHQWSGWPEPALEVRACEPPGPEPPAGWCSFCEGCMLCMAPFSLTAPSGLISQVGAPGKHGGELTARAGTGHTVVPSRAAWLAGA